MILAGIMPQTALARLLTLDLLVDWGPRAWLCCVVNSHKPKCENKRPPDQALERRAFVCARPAGDGHRQSHGKSGSQEAWAHASRDRSGNFQDVQDFQDLCADRAEAQLAAIAPKAGVSFTLDKGGGGEGHIFWASLLQP